MAVNAQNICTGIIHIDSNQVFVVPEEPLFRLFRDCNSCHVAAVKPLPIPV